jgi:hypothetical protein
MGAFITRKILLMAVVAAGNPAGSARRGGSNSELAVPRPASESAEVGSLAQRVQEPVVRRRECRRRLSRAAGAEGGCLAPRDREGFAVMDASEGKLARVLIVRGAEPRP